MGDPWHNKISPSMAIYCARILERIGRNGLYEYLIRTPIDPVMTHTTTKLHVPTAPPGTCQSFKSLSQFRPTHSTRIVDLNIGGNLDGFAVDCGTFRRVFGRGPCLHAVLFLFV